MSQRPGPGAISRAIDAHRPRWGRPDLVARAPGRVNLIGEHTDYNDGFVLPMALPFDTVLAISRAPVDGATEIVSEGFGHAELGRPDAGALDPADWAVHLRGVHRLLTERGIEPGPWRATIASDVPSGASLSSSAAIEVAAALAILALAGHRWEPTEVALLGQRVENEIVGVPSGIMDQLISASARADHASLIDCRSLASSPRPLPPATAVAVMDTGTRRQLVDSAFAERRETCRRAAQILGVEALRDATEDDLDRLPAGAMIERRRARHVISENERTLAAAEAMDRDDPSTVGALMAASHASLRDDYEVSGDALDHIVEAATASPGCFGARMTGGGFAGCAVALVARDRTDDFTRSVLAGYRERTGQPATLWICDAAPGASVGPASDLGEHRD